MADITGSGCHRVCGGAIVQCETPNQLMGVIAHAVAHIAKGNIAEGRKEVAAALLLKALSKIEKSADEKQNCSSKVQSNSPPPIWLRYDI